MADYTNFGDSQSGNQMAGSEQDKVNQKLSSFLEQGFTGFVMTDDPVYAQQKEEEGYKTLVLPGVQIKPSIVPQDDPIAKAYTSIRGLMTDIGGDKDFISRRTKIMTMEQSIGQLLEDETAKERLAAEATFGLPALRDGVKKAMERDKMSWEFLKNGMYSDKTIQGQQRLAQLESQADLHVQRKLNENRELKNLVTNFQSFKALQDRLDLIQEKDRDKAEVKAEKVQQNNQQFLGAMPFETRQAINRANPNLADDNVMAALIQQGLKSAEGKEKAVVAEALSGSLTPKRFFAHGLLGSDIAMGWAVSEQAHRTAIPKPVVEGIVRTVQQAIADPVQGAALFRQVLKPTELNQFVKLQQGAVSGSKEDVAQFNKAKIALADRLAGKLLVDNINNDVMGWPKAEIGSPVVEDLPDAVPILKLLQNAKGPNGKISLAEFTAAYLGQELTPETRIQRTKALQTLHQSVIGELSRTAIFGNEGIDFLEEVGKMRAKASASTIQRFARSYADTVKQGGASVASPQGLILENLKRLGQDYFKQGE